MFRRLRMGTRHQTTLKAGGGLFVFLFMSVMALACFVGALVLGTAPRMDIEREANGSFRVTGSNSFSGLRFFTKTVTGVTDATLDDSRRDRLGDSRQERERQRKREHLVFEGADGSRLSWDREADQSTVRDFMRGGESSLVLRDEPPLWRMAAAWALAGFGFLVFLGGVRGLFPGAAVDLPPPLTRPSRLP